MEGSFGQDLFRNIFGWLDSIIYGFISAIYNTFTNIASYTIINNDILETFSQRIYALIGIFMLFKLTFSLINYFIDPDSFSDKKSGFGNLIQRVIISLVLLVLTPSLFNLAFKAQTYILKENILANLILGGEYNDISIEKREEMYQDAGAKMAFSVLSAFMHPEDQEVLTMTEDELKDAYAEDSAAIEHFNTYKTAIKENDIDALVGWYKLNTKEDIDGYYLFSYTPVISTIAGIIVLWILIVFCVDIGIRTVKLAFLQLIAPIPVLGYVDNKKGADIFKKWYTQCLSTYLELFVKLIAIYFVIFIITLITESGFYEYTINSNNELVTTKIENPDFFAQALIIIGLLIFANEVPKLISDMLGIKSEGFSLNPMKKIGASPIIGAGVGGLVGAGATAIGNYKTNRQLGSGIGSSFGSAVGGIFSGGARGAAAGIKEKTMTGTLKTSSSVAGKSSNKILEKANTSFWGRNIARVQQAAGIQTKGALMEKRVKSYNDFTKNMSNLKTAAGKRLDKKPNFTTTLKDKDGNIIKSVNIAQQRALVEALSNRDTSKYNDAELQKHVSDLAEAKSTLASAENEAKKDIMKDMVKQFDSGQLSSIDDADAIAALDSMKSAINDDPMWYSNLEHTYKDKDNNEHNSYTVNMSDAETFVEQASAAVGKNSTSISTSEEYKKSTANNDFAKNSSNKK